MNRGDVREQLSQIAHRLHELRTLIEAGGETLDVIVGIYSAREALAFASSAMIGDTITDHLSAAAQSPDTKTKEQRLQALLDLLPFVSF